jgi:hypothetical protein
MDISYYVTYDLPVPYKGLNVYPVTVKDYLIFTAYSQCFLLEKNTIPDPRVISMTNLEYIYKATEEDFGKTPYLVWFDRLLGLVLKDDKSFENLEESVLRYNYDDKGKPLFKIGDITYDSKDYEELKQIICTQNIIELPDESISKEVRDSLEKAREYKRKQSGEKTGSFEDYIISLASVTGWNFEYIYDMPVRKFIKSIRRTDNLIHYKIYLSASMSGMVEFKDKSFIKHWLTNIDPDEKDKYGDVSVDLEAMKGKVSLESAKKQHK